MSKENNHQDEINEKDAIISQLQEQNAAIMRELEEVKKAVKGKRHDGASDTVRNAILRNEARAGVISKDELEHQRTLSNAADNPEKKYCDLEAERRAKFLEDDLHRGAISKVEYEKQMRM